MADHVDNWTTFRDIVAGTRKKLLKNPNIPLAITQLKGLSLQMQDEENYQNAAMCHVKMATMYNSLDELNNERKQYLLAASMLRKAFDVHRQSGSRVFSPYTSDIGILYAKAIEIAMNQKALRLAGTLSIEVAELMKEAEVFPMAVEHLQRAIRLCEGEFYSYTKAILLLAEVQVLTDHEEDALVAMDDLWMTLMKTKSNSQIGLRMLRDCEVVTTLLLVKTKTVPAGRHRLLLESYGIDSVANCPKSPSRLGATNESSLSEDQFQYFKKLVQLIVSDDKSMALSLLVNPQLDFFCPLARLVVRCILQQM